MANTEKSFVQLVDEGPKGEWFVVEKISLDFAKCPIHVFKSNTAIGMVYPVAADEGDPPDQLSYSSDTSRFENDVKVEGRRYGGKDIEELKKIIVAETRYLTTIRIPRRDGIITAEDIQRGVGT